ncbi:MAG TPA: hypothetical protein PLT63_03590 [Syntrophales bacterium]|nr:hypothetical protein [Syntrophales bacterium]
MKLYRIKLRGMCGGLTTQVAYGCPYVVAESPNKALEIVQSYLSKKDIGFSDEREMVNIELLAEQADYPSCKIQLFIQGIEAQ